MCDDGAQIHVGDIGTAFRLTLKDEDGVVIDISSATTKQIRFKKPNGTVVTQTADFVTDGTDGKLMYITDSDDLDIKGPWQIQAYVVISTGSWYSNIEKFQVYGNL